MKALLLAATMLAEIPAHAATPDPWFFDPTPIALQKTLLVVPQKTEPDAPTSWAAPYLALRASNNRCWFYAECPTGWGLNSVPLPRTRLEPNTVAQGHRRASHGKPVNDYAFDQH